MVDPNDKYVTHRGFEFGQLQRHRGWFIALGALLMVLGLAVISSSYYATLFSIVLLGCFLLAAGVIQIAQSFLAHKWSGLFFSLLIGILYVVTGFLCVTRPEVTAIALTFWIAAFCFIAGLFRMVTSLIMRFKNWGWVFFNGLITFILGLMIYSDWPVSGLWVIGLFLGIDILLSGWTWIMLAATCPSCKE